MQSRLYIFANFLVGALKLQLINVKSLSEWQLTIEINQRSQPSFGSFEDGFDRLIGVFGIQRNVKEGADGFDKVEVPLVPLHLLFIHLHVDLLLCISLLIRCQFQELNLLFLLHYFFFHGLLFNSGRLCFSFFYRALFLGLFIYCLLRFSSLLKLEQICVFDGLTAHLDNILALALVHDLLFSDYRCFDQFRILLGFFCS